MGNNRHKNMQLKEVWFNPKEYHELVNAIESNDKEKVLDLIWLIYFRGDL